MPFELPCNAPSNTMRSHALHPRKTGQISKNIRQSKGYNMQICPDHICMFYFTKSERLVRAIYFIFETMHSFTMRKHV